MALERMVRKAAGALRDPVTRADTAASLSFSITVGGGFELAYAHLTPEQMLGSRLMNGTIAAILGRPIGKVKDYLRRRTGTSEESHWLRRSIVDGIAYQLWLPTYTAAVYLSGARGEKLSHAVTACAISCMMTSIPYNLWQDRLRSWMVPKSTAEPQYSPVCNVESQYRSPRKDPFDLTISRFAPEVLE